MFVNCAFCGIEVKKKPSKVKDNNFCSMECCYSFRKTQNLEQKQINKITKRFWTNMNIRAGKYRHCQTEGKNFCYQNIEVKMTRDEFKEFVKANLKSITTLERPSLDRIDSNLHYSLDNIRFIELKDNIRDKEYGCSYINGPKHGTLRGVRETDHGTFSSRISYKGKTIHLGTFKTKEEAYRVFEEKYIELRGFSPWEKDKAR